MQVRENSADGGTHELEPEGQTEARETQVVGTGIYGLDGGDV